MKHFSASDQITGNEFWANNRYVDKPGAKVVMQLEKELKKEGTMA
jgi:hypothetical protein